ncbi:hypothetical protein ACLMJK_002188 [Lecanora helva]
MPNWKLEDAAPRLLACVMGAHPDLHLNYTEIAKLYGRGTCSLHLPFLLYSRHPSSNLQPLGASYDSIYTQFRNFDPLVQQLKHEFATGVTEPLVVREKKERKPKVEKNGTAPGKDKVVSGRVAKSRAKKGNAVKGKANVDAEVEGEDTLGDGHARGDVEGEVATADS